MAKLAYKQPDGAAAYVDTTEIAAILQKPGGKGSTIVLKSGFTIVTANDATTTATTDWNAGQALASAAGFQ